VQIGNIFKFGVEWTGIGKMCMRFLAVNWPYLGNGILAFK